MKYIPIILCAVVLSSCQTSRAVVQDVFGYTKTGAATYGKNTGTNLGRK